MDDGYIPPEDYRFDNRVDREMPGGEVDTDEYDEELVAYSKKTQKQVALIEKWRNYGGGIILLAIIISLIWEILLIWKIL